MSGRSAVRDVVMIIWVLAIITMVWGGAGFVIVHFVAKYW